MDSGSLADWISSDYSDKIDPEGQKQFKLLLNRVKRMDNLIEGILKYSKAGRIREEKEEIDLNPIVDLVIEMIARPEHIEIVVENELPVVACERTRIIQIFQNLISNAIKYMDKPQGKITIGVADDGDFWKFRVEDNGPGIEEKHFEKLFQLFQTLAPRDEVESTGVGLALVKKIVEMHGGRIWVESKIDQGSAFFFTLPKGG